MIIFVDESGIHKQTDNSTFVLVFVEMKNYQLINTKIIAIEKELRIDYFHWSEQSWKMKEKFMREALKLDFKVRIAVVKNPINPSIELEKSLTHLIIEKNINNIFIDGKKPAWYGKKLKKVLRDKGIKAKKLKMVKISQYPGIRLADMVAGLSRTYFDEKKIDKVLKYYRKLENKELILIKI